MILQQDPDLLDYVNAKLYPDADVAGSSFLTHFLRACQYADHNNYPIIRPALLMFREKYPADPARLEAEREDNPEDPVDSY